MSLSVALNTARNSLLTTAKQIAVSGRNVASADDPSYTRKIATPTTTADGSARILSIARATDAGLFTRVLGATSAGSGQQAILDGLERLHDTVGDTDSGTSPAARMAALAQALQASANAPSERALGYAAISAAEATVASLADATAAVTRIRTDADMAMASSVTRINDLLAKFTELNTAAVRGSFTGEDVTGVLDQRDAILGSLSEELGITTVQRSNNDIAIYTDGGVPLFDKTPRTVAFTTNSALSPGTTGNAVHIDGVPVTGDNAPMPLLAGRLAGLAALRDEVTVTYQAQLDEMARGLVEAFAEADQSGNGGPLQAGLISWTGGPGVPASGMLVDGIAAMLSVNAAVNPAQGGTLDRLRDGGINGTDYSYNLAGAASFADRLQEMTDALSAARNFDGIAGLESGLGLRDFGLSSIGWLENLRQTTTTGVEYQGTLLARTSEALSSASGVNVDDEYARQLQLEQSYQASSKLIAIVQQLFDTLLDAVA